MNYRVLARRWRPQNFDDVISQQHVVQSLVNALTQNRLHHAYLFTGTRGVGKTSIARILARCLNCLEGVSAKPCNTCDACQAIQAGNFFDLIEVDAASRTKVEDTRELLDNVQYAPSQGRYKIYLIDEVHMLSGHSFNALLKTLEEPPPHVIFLLATTDPQRLPITVLSRCLQFHLKLMPLEQITQHLAHILDGEQIPYEPAALHPLAYAAKGSMRDALSLLDQAIAYSNKDVSLNHINAMLGNTSAIDLFALLEALFAKDAHKVITLTQTFNSQGADFLHVLSDLQHALHQLTLCQAIPDLALHNPWNETDKFKALTNKVTPQDLQRYYAITLKGQTNLPLSPSLHSGFEMLLLEMIGESATTTSPAKAASTPPPAKQSTASDWATIVQALNISGITQAIASHCTLDKLTDSAIYLTLSPDYQPMFTATQQQKLTTALTEYFNKERRIEINIDTPQQLTPAQQAQSAQEAKMTQTKAALKASPQVQDLVNEFDANIVEDSLQSQE